MVQTTVAAMSNVGVAVRVRPLTTREKSQEIVVKVDVDRENVLLVTNPKTQRPALSCKNRKLKVTRQIEDGGDGVVQTSRQFLFDFCYNPASQEKIHGDVGAKVLDAAFEGYNACVLAYGQSGSGKTFTMMGHKGDLGLIPRICKGLFNRLEESMANQQLAFRTQVSFLEIYNEKVSDLLKATPDRLRKSNLRVREHPKLGPCVQDLSKHLVTDFGTVWRLIERGIQHRRVAATKMHDRSSRSHAVFTINFTQISSNEDVPSEVISRIHLVDLAGSEKATIGMNKVRLNEGANINKSLVALGSVIFALAERSAEKPMGDSSRLSSPVFVPYRASVLTWLLKDTLGGNSKTILMATVSPACTSYNETMSTLRYAQRAKCIVNKPIVNENPNVKLIRELKAEVAKLRRLLFQNNFGQLMTMNYNYARVKDMNGCRSLAISGQCKETSHSKSTDHATDVLRLTLSGDRFRMACWFVDSVDQQLHGVISHSRKCTIAYDNGQILEPFRGTAGGVGEEATDRIQALPNGHRATTSAQPSTMCLPNYFAPKVDQIASDLEMPNAVMVVESRGAKAQEAVSCYQFGFISSTDEEASSSTSTSCYVDNGSSDVDRPTTQQRRFPSRPRTHKWRRSNSTSSDDSQVLWQQNGRGGRRSLDVRKPKRHFTRRRPRSTLRHDHSMTTSPPPLCAPLDHQQPANTWTSKMSSSGSPTMVYMGPEWGSTETNIEPSRRSTSSLDIDASSEDRVAVMAGHEATLSTNAVSMPANCPEVDEKSSRLQKHSDVINYGQKQLDDVMNCQMRGCAGRALSDSGFRTFDSCTDDVIVVVANSSCQTSAALTDIECQTDPLRSPAATQTAPLPVDVATQTPVAHQPPTVDIGRAPEVEEESPMTPRRRRRSNVCEQCHVFRRELWQNVDGHFRHSDYESASEANFRSLPPHSLSKKPHWVNASRHNGLPDSAGSLVDNDAVSPMANCDLGLTVEVMSLLRECRAVRKKAWRQICMQTTAGQTFHF